MSKKLYYDNPLHAALMAEQFAVSYTAIHPKSLATFDISAEDMVESMSDCGGDWNTDYYWIHPDSLHIFEPQVGDLVEGKDKYGVKIGILGNIATKLKDKPCSVSFITDSIGIKYNNIHTIIRRNGLPFLMPKEEK